MQVVLLWVEVEQGLKVVELGWVVVVVEIVMDEPHLMVVVDDSLLGVELEWAEEI